ncbi:YeiH family protein [Actinoplanes sp. G11-F43]|uniref:YeiH family protein n=1 Tax=Actinoplanes sp. G11-F43 TaxID=3424130 RepID=UPI003D33A61B
MNVLAHHRAPALGTGVVAAVLLGLAATAAATVLPLVGAPVIAIVGGVLLSPLIRRVSPGREPAAGLDRAAGPALRLSVVLLGTQLSLGEVVTVGTRSLPVMLSTLGVCLLLAVLLGRWLGVSRDLRTLIGVGTGICGASAIAAATPAIRAKSDDVTYAMSTIFLFNVAAMLALPPIGHALGLSQEAFGLLAGTAVNDTSSVVAAAGAYGPEALDQAVVVKLARSLMIIPVVFVLGLTQRGGGRGRLVPWFLIGFLILAEFNTLGLIAYDVQNALRHVALLLIAVAMAAIGSRTDLGAIRRVGVRPLLLGLILSLAVTVTSLVAQHLTGGPL